MYQVINQYIIKHLETGTYIPCDEANMHYQVYLAWVADGNTPLPLEE